MSTPVETIPKHLHKDFIHTFWVMMSECENNADNDNDRILKHWVEGWFRQWNELNCTNLKPKWIVRQELAAADKKQ